MQFVSGIAVLDFAETGITDGFAVVFGKQETGFFHIVVGVPLPVKGAVRKVDADFNVGGVKKPVEAEIFRIASGSREFSLFLKESIITLLSEPISPRRDKKNQTAGSKFETNCQCPANGCFFGEVGCFAPQSVLLRT